VKHFYSFNTNFREVGKPVGRGFFMCPAFLSPPKLCPHYDLHLHHILRLPMMLI
jgi:hypothetical protein